MKRPLLGVTVGTAVALLAWGQAPRNNPPDAPPAAAGTGQGRP
jgi:hypothetical protein